MVKKMILTCVILCFIQLQAFCQKYKETLLTSKDGVEIKGSLYKADKACIHMKEDCDCKVPVVMLIHMLGRTRADWEDFAAKLQEAGYNVLAIDLRGHGSSTAKKGAAPLNYKKFTDKDWNEAVNDIAVAVTYMLGAKPDRPCIIIGASIGSNLAIKYAAADKNISGVALLSPSSEYKGVKIESDIVTYGRRPLFIASSKDDDQSYSKFTVLKACAERGGAGLKTLEYKNAGHGTEIFASGEAPKLDKELIDWLNMIVKQEKK